MFNVVLVILALVSNMGQAQSAPPGKPMGEPLSFFVGQWEGAADGEPGRGTTQRSYEYPAGWRAKESYVFEGTDAFTETFELAEPGKEFAVYSKTRFTRKK
jgi:hypothetical protein